MSDPLAKWAGGGPYGVDVLRMAVPGKRAEGDDVRLADRPSARDRASADLELIEGPP